MNLAANIFDVWVFQRRPGGIVFLLLLQWRPMLTPQLLLGSLTPVSFPQISALPSRRC